MYHQFKRFLSYSIFGVLSSLIGFLTVPYLTRSLTPEEYGTVGIFMSFLYFITPVLSLSSEGLVGIKKINDTEEKYQDFVNQYVTLILVLALLALIVGLIVGSAIGEYILIAISLPIVGLLQSLSRLHSIELVQDKLSRSFGLYTIVSALFLFLITYLSISVFSLGWIGRIIALISAELLMLIIRCHFTFKSLKMFNFKLSKGFCIEIVKFGSPLMILLVASWLLNESDRFIVLNFLSLSDVGIYSAAYSLGLAINILNNAMTNTMVPNIYQTMKDGRGRKNLRRLTLFYSLFIFITSLFSAFIFYNFGGILLGDNYDDGVLVTCIILVAFGFNGMYRTVGLPLDYLKMNVLKTVNFSIAAIINVAISIAMFDMFGFLAPAIGTLISFILLYILTLYFNLKYTAFLSQ